MRVTTIVLLVGMAGAVLAGSGCIAVADNDPVQYRLPTLGKELTDLSKARDAGAVTEPEYQRLRQKLLERDRRVAGSHRVHDKS